MTDWSILPEPPSNPTPMHTRPHICQDRPSCPGCEDLMIALELKMRRINEVTERLEKTVEYLHKRLGGLNEEQGSSISLEIEHGQDG